MCIYKHIYENQVVAIQYDFFVLTELVIQNDNDKYIHKMKLEKDKSQNVVSIMV